MVEGHTRCTIVKPRVDIYQLFSEVNGGVLVARLLPLAAAAEHANLLEPAGGLHRFFHGLLAIALDLSLSS